MKHYDFNRLVERSNSLSVKYNREAIASICNNPDAKPFWVADMDFAAPPAVLEALKEQVEHGVLGYPRFPHLKETISAWLERRHGWSVKPSLIATAPGMLASIATLVELYSQEGEGVIVPMPAYKPFITIVEGLGRKLIPWPMLYDGKGGFSLDFDHLRDLLEANHTPIILFCSPHNPTGRVFTLEELTQLVEVAATFKAMIISDEIHGDLTYAHNTHIPLGTLIEASGVECATCVAPSKTFNIAGQHFSSVICSSSEMYRKLTQRMETLRISPDILATVAASAAYSGGYEWLMDLNHYLSNQVERVVDHFNESNSGLLFVPPEASFIGLIDCSAIYERVAEEAQKNADLYNPRMSPQGGLLSRFFGQKAAIAMNDGSWFGEGWKNFVRFNFATTQERVAEALKAITAAVAELN